ncbi:MAG: DNA polymerase III subunit gamma/tau, partial [Bacteroidales bacterium]
MNPFVVSARKYRPQQFKDVVDQDNIVATLKNAIQRKQLAHAYLFC